MRKVLFLLLMFTGVAFTAGAQKYAYVNTDEIMKKMTEYKEAQTQIDQLSESWQKEVEKKKAEVKKMFDEFRRDEVMLTDDMKKRRLDEIEAKEGEVKEFQRQKFGVNGELFTKRQELLKPIQEKIYKAIKEVAEAGNYQFIFDMANNSSILYADPKLDKTETVMRKLGITK